MRAMDNPTKVSHENFSACISALAEGRNVLLHGPGGTGKSFCLRKIASALQAQGKVVACTATTGVAAVNLRGEDELETRTLHSWSGVKLGRESAEKLYYRACSKKVYRDRWKETDVLIIDEISMLGASLLEKLDYIGRKMRGPPNRFKGEVSKPFGGLQVIFSGDFLQLPPVKETWCFESRTWRELDLCSIIFSDPKRYDDLRYFKLLLRIREGKQTKEDITLLRKRVNAYDRLQQVLDENKQSVLIKPTILFSRRVDVGNYNKRELEKLSTDDCEFIAEDDFSAFVKGTRKASYETLLDDMIPKSIKVRAGAQVMLKANLDVQGGLVNGSRGVITDILPSESIICVKFLNGKSLRLARHIWSVEDKNGAMTRSQFPIILAWACTIHKGQGATLDYAICDLGPSVFAEGQAYVALSRVRNLKGLFISELYPPCIKANPDAIAFEKKING